MAMTDHEHTTIDRLSEEVSSLATAVNQLTLQLGVSLKAEEACRGEVRAQHSVLFGIDGDRTSPGLQRIVDEHGRRLDDHDGLLAEIRGWGSWWRNNLWTFVTVGGITIGGAILNAWFLHVWK